MTGILFRNMYLLFAVFLIQCPLLTSHVWASPASVPQSGQSTSNATRDDGAMKMGYLLPTQRFTDNLNGMVTDNLTGLIWLKDGNCFGNKNWTEAIAALSTLASGVCGLGSTPSVGTWSLPNLNELKSLTTAVQADSATWLNSLAFLSINSGKYWSSTTVVLSTDNAWTINMGDGSLTYMLKLSSAGVLPVFRLNTLHETTVCIACHDDTGWMTPGDGKPLVPEWKNSTHMTTNSAGCADCHDDGYMHPASCSTCHNAGTQAKNPTNNPDRDGKCAKCHAKVNPRVGQNDGLNTPVIARGVPVASYTRFTHYSTGLRTNYVSSNNQLHCRNCHNPHDTTFGKEQRQDWSKSGHGITRGLARIFLDAKTRGTRIPLDQNTGNGNYCVRCHTSTGFINFVAGDQFTDVNALPDIGADGLPDPTGYRSNWPEYKIVNNVPVNVATNIARPYQDKSREATNCNVCHLDQNGTSSYSGTLRKVAIATGVKIYYPYSSSGNGHFKNVTPVQYDTLSSSNLCLTCHSGRATGQTIRNPGLNFLNRPSVPNIHDFAGGAVLQGEKSGFLFYTSSLKYKTFTAHRTINSNGSGPCITCHMPMVQSAQTGGQIHSHLFRPVSWTQDDINQDITEIISNPTVCSNCHNGAFQPSLTPKYMNDLRKGFRVSVLILAALRPSSNNWTGQNSNGGLGVTGPTYGNSTVPALGNLPAGAYTMGASYNYGFFFNEPSSYNHSPILTRQLIYDSIDWIKNGAGNFGKDPASVFAAMKNVPLGTGLTWTKVDTVAGENTGGSVNKNYATYTTEADRDAAFFWLCKDYVSGSDVCNRW